MTENNRRGTAPAEAERALDEVPSDGLPRDAFEEAVAGFEPPALLPFGDDRDG